MSKSEREMLIEEIMQDGVSTLPQLERLTDSELMALAGGI